MGQSLFKQVQKLLLVYFPCLLFSFNSFSIHLIPTWLFLEIFLHYYSGQFFTGLEMGLFVLFPLAISYLYPPMHLLR